MVTMMLRSLFSLVLLCLQSIPCFCVPNIAAAAAFVPSQQQQLAGPSSSFRLTRPYFAYSRKSALSSSSSTPSTLSSTPSAVRRVYETYVWKYQDQAFHINYRVEGPTDGQPILLIHGFGANVNHFRYNIPVLSSAKAGDSSGAAAGGYRVYAIDLLGFGASDKPSNVKYCMELFFQQCTDFITDMNNLQQNNANSNDKKCWFVAGNSIGGLTALGVARAIPHVIQGVVLFACADGMSFFRYADIPFYLWPLVWFFQKVVLSPFIGGAFFENFKTRENVQRVLRQQGVYVDTTHVDEELLEILLAPGQDVGAQDVFLKVFGGDPGPRPASILPNVVCPILALWGGQDPWTTVNGSAGAPFRELASSSSSTTSTGTRSVELDIIPNAGHCVMDEVPDKVHHRMIPWMEEVQQRYDPRKVYE